MLESLETLTNQNTKALGGLQMGRNSLTTILSSGSTFFLSDSEITQRWVALQMGEVSERLFTVKNEVYGDIDSTISEYTAICILYKWRECRLEKGETYQGNIPELYRFLEQDIREGLIKEIRGNSEPLEVEVI